VVLVFVLLLWPALSIWFLRRNDEPGDSNDDGGSGGPPPGPPGPDGPVWWPEFERDFAAYVAAIGNDVDGRPVQSESAARRSDSR